MAAPLWENWPLFDLLCHISSGRRYRRGPNLLLLIAIFTQLTGPQPN
jgi:hypothetical protein